MQPVSLDPNRTGRDAKNLDGTLRRLVIGQEEAIEQIVNMYQMNQTGLSAPGRPVANFLFLGPTGTGKTRTVEATAEALAGTSRAVIKIDCAEFQHSHEIAKLVGSPPGYLGHRETHALLSQEMINSQQNDKVKLSFLLFDEIEKASDALWNLLLGILDKATLTLGDNRKVDFSRCMIFMTSNLGASEVDSILSPRMGFSPLSDTMNPRSEKVAQRITQTSIEAARRKFTPEFLNRIDKIVVFKPLGQAELKKILDLELYYVQQRVFQTSDASKAFVFTVTDEAKKCLLEQGTDAKYNARHLKRAIERLLVQPMSNLIATEQIRGGDWVKVSMAGSGQVTFDREAEGLPIHIMAQLVHNASLAGLESFTRAGAAAAARPAQPASRSARR